MARSRNILIVDDDPMMSEMLESVIELHNPGYHAILAEGPEEALAFFGRETIDLVITELRFAGSPYGAEFATALAQRMPPVPFLALTGLPLSEIPRAIKPRHILRKPVPMDALLQRVDEIFAEAADSILKGLRLETFLQVLYQERKSAALTVAWGEHRGYLFIRLGELVHAAVAGTEGKQAAFIILSWPEYVVKMTEDETAVPERTIHERLPDLLLQWCVYHDQCAA